MNEFHHCIMLVWDFKTNAWRVAESTNDKNKILTCFRACEQNSLIAQYIEFPKDHLFVQLSPPNDSHDFCQET